MAGALDYLRWRGDLSFQNYSFNSVDAALMASLVYLPGNNVAIGHTLGDLAKHLRYAPTFQHQMHDETGTEVFLLPECPRFGQLKILDWTNRMEVKPHPLQFTAATFRLDPHTIIIAYRGTDSTMIGWNEDMRMNYLPQIYGQNVATSYLKRIAKQFPHDRIYLVGHSKGGNFALYSLSLVKPKLQERIIRAYNFDGPGFFHQIMYSSGFKRALPKMKTYLPEASIIGTMLDHPERTLIVKSNVGMTNQHDPRRWRVGRDSFVLARGLTPNARLLRHSFIHFNHSIPNAKRGAMWSALFAAFSDLDIHDVNQITAHKFIGTVRFSRVLMSLEPDLRKIFTQAFIDVLKTYRHNLPFTKNEYQLFPASNDSSKTPIFYEFYDPKKSSLPLPKAVRLKREAYLKKMHAKAARKKKKD